jgi:hypothetical protein
MRNGWQNLKAMRAALGPIGSRSGILRVFAIALAKPNPYFCPFDLEDLKFSISLSCKASVAMLPSKGKRSSSVKILV